jgi:hypothetical protein
LQAEIHAVVLYAVCVLAVAVVACIRGSQARPSTGRSPGALKALWPFMLLAVVESLSLNSNGHLLAQWLLPGLACTAVILIGRNDRAVNWARRALVLSAIVLWLHGGWLLTHGYVTHPSALAQTRKVESAWYSPFTGLRPTSRVAAPARPTNAHKIDSFVRI